MGSHNEEKLPDRKRFDKGSDLTAIESQHHQEKEIIRYDADHLILLGVNVWAQTEPYGEGVADVCHPALRPTI
jgi:hypothetical protein